MTREVLYEDAQQIDFRDTFANGETRGTEWKPGSPGHNQQQVRDQLAQALANWNVLTALQKDKLLRFCIRFILGQFDGQ